MCISWLYATTPPLKYAALSGTSVILLARYPPIKDSLVARGPPRSLRSFPTGCPGCSTSVPPPHIWGQPGHDGVLRGSQTARGEDDLSALQRSGEPLGEHGQAVTDAG